MSVIKVFYASVLIFFGLLSISAQSLEDFTDAYENKEYQSVINHYTKLNESSADNTELIEFEILQKTALSYYHLNEFRNAIPIFRDIVKTSIAKKQHNDAYFHCYYLSRCFKKLFEMDSAVFYSEIGAQQAALTKSNTKTAKSLHNLAVVYSEIGNYTKALITYEKSLESVKEDSSSSMQTRSNIAHIYYKIGLLDSAFKIASDAYNYFLTSKDDEYWRWLTTFRLAFIEKDYKNELAEFYYKELINISDNDYDQALAEIGLGETLLKKENDSALYYFEIAEMKANKSQNEFLIREVNFNKARVYLTLQPDQQKLEKALKVVREILDTQKYDWTESTYRILESKYFLNEDDFEKSINSVNEAINNASELNHKDRLAEALAQKFNVLNHFGRYKEALAVKEEQIKVQQELFNDRSEAVYQILRTQNEMDKQESTIANQQLVIDNNNLQFTIMYISIALVISALVFIFWQYRTRSKYARKLETMFLDSRHRYMNNLLLLKNWFNEGKTEKNDEIISFAQNRIDAISTVNRHLDRLSYNKDTIESRSFLEDISHNLLANREFTSDIENVPINMSASGPLGMITNEIITNGLKYGEEPYAIRFHKNGKGYVLEIEDHGPGIADPEKKGTGSKVLRLLSRQLKGELVYQNKADHTPDGRGTLVSLIFKG